MVNSHRPTMLAALTVVCFLSGGGASSSPLTALGRLPLYFVENRGQVDPKASFYVTGRDAAVYLTASGFTFTFTRLRREPSGVNADVVATSIVAPDEAQRPTADRWAMSLDLVGARTGIQPEGRRRTAAIVSYFKGPREKWTDGLRTFSEIFYRDVWPGVDLEVDGTGGQLKYTFVVHPGADPSRIRLR